MIIRCGLERDYKRIEKLVEEGQEYHVKLRPDMYKTKNNDSLLTEKYYNELIRNQQIFVAENADGLVVGYIICVQRYRETEYLKGYKTLFVDSLAVAEEFRGCGIARALMEWIIEYAKEMKNEKIELQVNAKNNIARILYKDIGFTEKSINMEMNLLI